MSADPGPVASIEDLEKLGDDAREDALARMTDDALRRALTNALGRVAFCARCLQQRLVDAHLSRAIGVTPEVSNALRLLGEQLNLHDDIKAEVRRRA